MPLVDVDSDWDDNEFPIAYFITFRTHGTWLHGDSRGSTMRYRAIKTGSKRILPDNALEEAMRREMKEPPFVLNGLQRKAATSAIKDFCKKNGYTLYALNVRSNHVHCVIGVQAKPERIADALKACVTKRLREERLVGEEQKAWSRGRSRRYLWKGGMSTRRSTTSFIARAMSPLIWVIEL